MGYEIDGASKFIGARYFWEHCKSEKRCEHEPYTQLLQNSILKADWEKFNHKKRKRDSQIVDDPRPTKKPRGIQDDHDAVQALLSLNPNRGRQDIKSWADITTKS